MLNRRAFLRLLGTTGVWMSASALPTSLLAADFHRLTILHTNDVHSRIDPFPSGSKKGLGGAAKRATLIKKVAEEADQLLLLDAGDIFQGTPYFNFFEGELEFKLMNSMGYHGATIGNHDFDAGMEALKKQLNVAQFSMINANYDFSKTILDGMVRPYAIYKKGPIKVGVFGLGVELDGLVPPNLFGKTKYLDPIKKANEIAEKLKVEEQCHLVVCLSHLGYKYTSDKVSDHVLAKKTSHIDLIIGGHTHTFLEEPTTLINRDGQEVLVNQVGWAGIQLGRLDFYFRKDFKAKRLKTKVIDVA